MTAEQSRMLRLLCVFKEICETHRLRYYLAGGTLLGAVRHQGFIPWDDDIDVSMPLNDFQKFQELCAALPERVEIQSEENDPRYPFVFCKLCDTTYPFHTGYPNEPKGVYIDIFPLLPSRRLNGETKFRFEVISVINYLLQVKLDWTGFIPYKLPWARFGYWLLSHFSVEQLRSIRRKQISRLYRADGEEALCSPGGVYQADKEFFPTEWYRDAVQLIFEGESFCAPVGFREYLSRNYGDYMELPVPEERGTRHRKKPEQRGEGE